jgi:hypothetical protein
VKITFLNARPIKGAPKSAHSIIWGIYAIMLFFEYLPEGLFL